MLVFENYQYHCRLKFSELTDLLAHNYKLQPHSYNKDCIFSVTSLIYYNYSR